MSKSHRTPLAALVDVPRNLIGTIEPSFDYHSETWSAGPAPILLNVFPEPPKRIEINGMVANSHGLRKADSHRCRYNHTCESNRWLTLFIQTYALSANNVVTFYLNDLASMMVEIA